LYKEKLAWFAFYATFPFLFFVYSLLGSYGILSDISGVSGFVTIILAVFLTTQINVFKKITINSLFYLLMIFSYFSCVFIYGVIYLIYEPSGYV